MNFLSFDVIPSQYIVKQEEIILTTPVAKIRNRLFDIAIWVNKGGMTDTATTVNMGR